MSFCASGYRCQFILEPLSQITFRVSWTQILLLIFGLISRLGLETISLGWWEWAFLGYHVVRWQYFLLLPLRSIHRHRGQNFLVLLMSYSGMLYLFMIMLQYVRCDIPISIVPTILSVTWDVMRGGWLGPTMV